MDEKEWKCPRHKNLSKKHPIQEIWPSGPPGVKAIVNSQSFGLLGPPPK